MKLTASEIIEQKLVESGMSVEDITYLICRFLEEEAQLYVDATKCVEE